MLTCSPSINCRLPQTPRTPSTAAAHYFDDVFSRPSKPANGKPHHFRRSSTNRSIGNRSSVGSLNGDDEDTGTRANSVAIVDDEEKAEADKHVANYVGDQLERIRSNESAVVYEDEFEAQLDGH